MLGLLPSEKTWPVGYELLLGGDAGTESDLCGPGDWEPQMEAKEVV